MCVRNGRYATKLGIGIQWRGFVFQWKRRGGGGGTAMNCVEQVKNSLGCRFDYNEDVRRNVGEGTLKTERFHVIASRPADGSASLIRRIGAILHMAPYDVRLRLNPVLPRCLATFGSSAQAVSAAEMIAAEGLRVTVFAESRLPPAVPLRVRRWQISGDELCATDRNGEVQAVRAAELERIMFGRRVVVSVESDLETELFIGAPGVSNDYVLHKDQHITGQPLFALLLPNDLARRAMLFDADTLEFECLGGSRGASGNANMLRLNEILRDAYPDAVLDRTLLEHRVEPEHFQCYNRQSNVDAAVALAFVIAYLGRAMADPRGLYIASEI